MKTADLVPYANNAKIHTAEQVEQIKESIKRFGMIDPIAIWKGNVVIEGHGRLLACQELGIEEVPIIRLDHLTDKERKEYALIHNKLTNNTGFDNDLVDIELDEIGDDIDMSVFGFDMDSFEEGDIFDMFGDAPEKENQESPKHIISCPQCGRKIEIDDHFNIVK